MSAFVGSAFVCNHFFSECVSVKSSFAPDELLRRDLFELLLRADTARGRLAFSAEEEKSAEGERGGEKVDMVPDESWVVRSMMVQLFDGCCEVVKDQVVQDSFSVGEKAETANKTVPKKNLV